MILGVFLFACISCSKDNDAAKGTASVYYHVEAVNASQVTVYWNQANGMADSAFVNGSHWTRTQSVSKPFQASLGGKITNAAANAKIILEIRSDGNLLLKDSSIAIPGGELKFTRSITVN